MERILQRDDNVLVNYISPVQRSSMDPSSSSSSLRNSADVDFHDVFGGPPRRYSSTQDARHSLSEARELSRFRGRDDETSASGSVRWSGLGDRPVFGEQEGPGTANHRRRYPSEDFFDDIFRGGEDKDPYSSSPGSRVMSPARPLPPPKSDIFGSPSPSQFSLPATVNKGLELPSFGSPTRGPYSHKDEAQSVPSIPPSRSNSQSRLSSQSFKVQDEIRTDTRSDYRQSPLSIEFSLSSDGSVKVTDSETDSGETLKKDSNSSNVPIANSNQFHFSIYKWASKGVPLMVSLRSSNGAKVKERSNLSRCLSSKGRIERDGVVNESPTETLSGVDFSSSNHNVSATTESNRMEGRKEDTEVFVKETVAVATPEKEIVVDSLSTNKDVPDNNTISRSKPNSPLGRLRKHKEKVTAKLVEATHKTESRSIRSVVSENDDGQGKDKTSRETAMKDNMATTTVKSTTVVGAGRTLRKRDAKKINHADEEVEKAALRSSPSETVDSVEGSKIKGKVKEFVKIFNKETLPPKRVPITDTQRQSYEWKDAANVEPDKEINVDLMKADDGIQHTINPDKDKKSENAEAVPSSIAMDNEKTSANASFKVHKDSKLSKKNTDPVGESTSFTLNDAHDQKDVRSSTEDSKTTFATMDDFFDDDFSVKEISEDQHMLITQSSKDEDDFKASDAKIRGWASGKETNIRSLLSTLQYVLWPESGWKPVPLVDIIEASAVKRSYQRALLYLHPDKLQQKGADAHKKYIAEQVFDKLQDAWIHFNSLGSL